MLVVFSTQAGPYRRTVPLAARNSYPSDVRLLEQERPLDVHDDRACRAVARARSVVLVAGRWARPSCCGSGSSRASAMTLPLWGMRDSLSSPRPLEP